MTQLIYEYKIIRILHESEKWIVKAIMRVIVWYHKAPLSDTKQLPEGQICPSVPQTLDSFYSIYPYEY